MPEENGEGGQISREVGEAKIEVIERLKSANSRCWLPMLVVAEQARGETLQVTNPLPSPSLKQMGLM